ncbi:MAG: acyl-CoA thioesterase [Chloroherpetonaceae bacterium]|nr:acyl-CoA thioesterase [Chloroherpetonaceae bacterium]
MIKEREQQELQITESKNKVYSRFQSEIAVRPDDIDLNQHVHNTRYLEYLLAARYDQMGRCYKMPMEDFIKLGFGWFVKATYIEYKRELGLGDTALVDTWIMEMQKQSVKVGFEIKRKSTGKLCTSGWIDYVMINIKTGKAETIPDFIIEKYSI